MENTMSTNESPKGIKLEVMVDSPYNSEYERVLKINTADGEVYLCTNDFDPYDEYETPEYCIIKDDNIIMDSNKNALKVKLNFEAEWLFLSSVHAEILRRTRGEHNTTHEQDMAQVASLCWPIMTCFDVNTGSINITDGETLDGVYMLRDLFGTELFSVYTNIESEDSVVVETSEAYGGYPWQITEIHDKNGKAHKLLMNDILDDYSDFDFNYCTEVVSRSVFDDYTVKTSTDFLGNPEVFIETVVNGGAHNTPNKQIYRIGALETLKTTDLTESTKEALKEKYKQGGMKLTASYMCLNDLEDKDAIMALYNSIMGDWGSWSKALYINSEED